MSKPRPKERVSLSKVFKTIVLPRWRVITVGLVLIIISRLAGLVLPAASKYLMDDVIGQGDLQMLKVLLLAVSGAITLQAITSYALTQLLSVEAQHLIARLRAEVQ